jgi:hypothetical protein
VREEEIFATHSKKISQKRFEIVKFISIFVIEGKVCGGLAIRSKRKTHFQTTLRHRA